MSSPHRIRVYLADDHPVYLEGLTLSAKGRPDIELVGQSGDGRQALADLKRLEPEVAVLDLQLPGLGGIEILVAAKRDELPTRIIFLSGYADGDSVYTAVANGAAGCLSKLEDHDHIFDAVAAVSRGEVVVSGDFQSGLAGEIQLREAEDRPVLTAREQEVLRMIADGKSAPEIAEELCLSPATIKTHLATLYRKLGVAERAAAVAVAMRSGLLE